VRTRSLAHATTLVANTVIERRGARTALLCTRGFRDVLEVRRHVRVTTYELWADPPAPLVPRALRIPVSERTGSDGRVRIPIDPAEIEAIADRLRREGVESVAIAFLHSYINPHNEAEAARLLGALAPELEVTTSASVLPQIKEFERTSATVINAYVRPLARRYLRRLDDGLRGLGFAVPLRIMLSTGGVGSAETAGELPVRLLESGPVAGAIVARQYAAMLGLGDVLSFDMGGTTAKACLVRDGALPITDELEVARSRRFTKSSGFPVPVPAVDLIEVGAGGGSIAAINTLGLVQVGPESAGADPGPICYGRGGMSPTVTDADLLLGYLDPAYFAGGTIRLDADAAARGLGDRLATPLGRDLTAAAWTVHDVVNETMAAAVRMHVTERGGNPERATLFAFGGAGPVHAYHLAAKLGVRRIMVPLRPGVLSALGLVIAPVAYDVIRTCKVPLAHVAPAAIDALFDEMAAEVALTLAKAEPGETPAFARAVDVGYVGQGYQVTVPADGGRASLGSGALWQGFAAVYREKYGYFYDDVPAEMVNLRLSGRLGGRALALAPVGKVRAAPATPKSERPAFSSDHGRMVPFAVYDRTALAPGMTLSGPAVVEEASATTVIDVGGALEVDAYGSLVISIGEATA
jgi:N-methylhydantoinase A